MTFDVIRFLNDFHIPYHTEGKNISKGWVEVHCPFQCGDPSFHGGFNLTKEETRYNCWLCGPHPLETVISGLTRKGWKTVKQIITTYSTQFIPTNEVTPVVEHIILPGSSMQKAHIDYLARRNFDAKYIEKKYSVLGTGPVGKYKFRIIIPFFYKGQIVTYQGRDITGQQTRYKNCRKDQEVVPIKTILYNLDRVKRRVLVLEGALGVWRVGDGAVSTSGIQYTKTQIHLLKEMETVFIGFDPEPQAQKLAHLMAHYLDVHFGIDTNLITFDKDLDNFTEQEVRHLRRELKL
jgi:hypothetical protein